ncbi:MAG: helix-turn-helix transcriptional regulator [Minisyncoccia bacterium]
MKTFTQFKTEVIKKSGIKDSSDIATIKLKISKAITERRTRESLTRKELAEQIGITQSSLYRFESGVVNPRWLLLKKVTAGLGLRLTVK